MLNNMKFYGPTGARRDLYIEEDVNNPGQAFFMISAWGSHSTVKMNNNNIAQIIGLLSRIVENEED